MGAFDDLIPGSNATGGAFDDLIPAEKPKKKRDVSAAEYLQAIDSGIAQGIANIGAAAGTVLQDPGGAAVSGVIGARAAADRGLTWLINQAGGEAENNTEAQRAAQIASQVAADRRAENASDPSNLPARLGRFMEQDSRAVIGDIQAKDRENNPELIRQQQAMGEAEGFVDNVKAAWDNPLALTHTLTRSLPDMAMGVGVGSALHRAGAGLGAVSRAGVATEAGSSAMQAREGTYQQMVGMPIESLAKSPRFNEILAEVKDPVKAREVLANELADQTPVLTAMGTAAGSLLTNRLFGGDATAKTIVGAEKMTGRELGKRIAQDTVEEGFQGVPEDTVQHGAVVQADPSKKWDPAGSLAQNMIAGLAMGTGGHGFSYATENMRGTNGGVQAPSGAPPAAPPAITPGTGNAPAGQATSITPQSGAADPTTRLAELEILAEQRDLTPVERTEVADLFTQLQQEEQGAPAEEVATPGPEAAPAAVAAQQTDLPSVINPMTGEEVAPTDPRYADVVDAKGSAAPEAATAAVAVDRVAPADFWSFAKSKGFTPAQIKIGTPEHAALKAEYDALKAGKPEPVLPPMQPQQNVDLQNRDRGRAASVVQMSEIARNPDYMRLGPSRTPDSGAPMVFAVGDQVNIEPQNFGRDDVAVMSDGQRVPFRYAVVDANTVNPSNFADGRQNPEFASTTPGTLKALNNGRTAGVRAAHEMGTAGEYVSGLQADEAMHGIPADVIARTPNPILVRVYSDGQNTAGMAAKSQGQGLGMSPSEMARQDAPLMDSSVLGVYEPGDVTGAANRDFVRAFMGKLQGAGQDVAGMMTGDGQLSQDGRKRIQAALMQAAYGDSDIVEEMFDSTDTDIKAIGEALKAVAGQWANMRDSAKLGAINPQADITQNLLQAIGLIRKARRDNSMVFDLVNQPDLMTGETPDATTVAVLRLFYSGQYMTRAVGKDKLAKSLGDYVTGAMATSADPGMFGDLVTPGDILATIVSLTEGQGNAETQPQESRREPAGSGTAGRGAGEERGRRQGAGESRTGSDQDSRGQSGQDAQAQAQQQVGQGGEGSEKGDAPTASRAGAQQPGTDAAQAQPASVSQQPTFAAGDTVAWGTGDKRKTGVVVRAPSGKDPATVRADGGDKVFSVKAEKLERVEPKPASKPKKPAKPKAAKPTTDTKPVATTTEQTSAEVQNIEKTTAAEAKPLLTAPTEADIVASQDASEAAQRKQEAADRAAKQQADQDEDRKRIAQASGRAADTFELGQNALDSLTGQQSMFDAPQEPAKPADPALDPDRIQKMAEGAAKQAAIDAKNKADFDAGAKDREAARQAVGEPDWVTFEGVDVLRLKDSKFVAVPNSGRKNAARFDIIDTNARDGVVAQVSSKEVRAWLIKAAKAEQEQSPDEKAESPSDFIPSPNGGLDYGEITPEMGNSMRRQAGKIRLTRGVQNTDGTGYGFVHIEANHGKQIRGAGFESVAEFVAHVASGIQQVWQVPGNSQLLVTAKNGRKDVMFIRLEISKDGDFYRVNSAFPVRQPNYEEQRGMKKIWDGSEPTSAVTGQRPAFATTASAAPDSESSQGSSNARGQDVSVSPTTQPAQVSDKPTANSKIDDFGEKIAGAKKDLWTGFSADLGAVADDDIANHPLSKVWPAPDYQALIDGGADPAVIAFVRAARDEVPAKPRVGYKVKGWATKVKTLRGLAMDLMSGKTTMKDVETMLERSGAMSRSMQGFMGRVELYQAVGHAKSLDGIRMQWQNYTLYKGEKNVSYWVVEKDVSSTSFGNWPTEIAKGKTKDEAIEAFRAAYDKLDSDKEAKKGVQFDIVSDRGANGYWIAKKIGRNYAKLAGPFTTVQEARTHRDKNQSALVEKLEKYKEIPVERRDVNEPRVGEDMRGGVDVTPQMFGDTFGFKGVQFGNWVEQGRRQKDLNNAFDALMDMAAVLGIPPKAISLNGQLGLAFGARGSGGVSPAAAHYEPDMVVINLTKVNGAGSLGHEWWHAVDNYFAKMRKGMGGSTYMTTASDVSLASRGSKYFAYEGVRKEMVEAFGNVVKAINLTGMKKRAAVLDGKRSKEYWTTGEEMSARSFEAYLIAKLQDQNASNDYLANIVSEGAWEAAAALGMENENSYPYPTAKEVPGIRAAFDQLFQTVQTKEDADGNVAIYSTTGRSVPLSAGQRVVEATVANEIEKRIGQFAHQPSVVIRDTAEGVLPGATKADGIAGAVHQGRIYLFLDQLANLAAVQETLFHELFHYGMRKIFTRDQFIQEMRRVYERDAWVKARADAWVKTSEGKAADKHGGADYAIARGVDEALARLAEPNAGDYTRTDAFNKAVVFVARWLSGLAERLGFLKYAAKLRGIKNQEARDLVQRVFQTLQSQERPEHDGWMDDAEPAFSRSTLGNTQPHPPQTPFQKLKAKALALTSPEAMDNRIYELQDKHIDLKRLRDHIKALGGTITDLNDAYLGEELYHKRVAKRTQDFLSEELKPLLADLRARGLDMPTFERFLHARHAPEANRVLAERNPNAQMIDTGKTKAKQDVKALEVQLQRAKAQGSATKAIEQALDMAREELSRWTGVQAFKGTEDERLSLSGMSDAEAAAFMAGLPAGQRVHLDALAARVDAMIEKTRAVNVKYGLETQQTIDAWKAPYQHYVPLHRDEAHPDSVGHPIGQGFSTKGDAGKRRTGSNEKVTNILAHIAMQREAALTRGEKNRVAKKLYLMAAQNPDPDVWTVDKPPMTRTIDRETGFVRSGVDPTYKNKPNVVMVRIGGKDHAIVFNERNPQAVRMAESIKNQDIGDMGMAMQWSAKFTRFFAAMSTQYNPVFTVVNFVRDVQGGIINLSSTPIADRKAQVAKDIGPALRAIYGDVRADRKGTAKTQNNWAKLWDEMQNEGGTTGYRDLFADPDERTKSIEKELAKIDRGDTAKMVDWYVTGLVSDMNEAVENSVRLATYKAALDSGMSKEQAASTAKNITVNFNRKGRAGAQANALYAFFNAAVQGNTRMIQTLAGPAGRKIIMGGIALGMLNTVLMVSMLGGDGEDDEYKNLPEFVKSRNLMIPLGGKDYMTVPLPLGLHVLPNIGRLMTEFAMGRHQDKGPAAVLGEVMALMLDAFNPLGGSENLAMVATPTPLDIPLGIVMNRDWQNRPIARENMSDQDPQPAHKLTRDSATLINKKVSELLNTMGGGDDYTPGSKWSQWTPDQLDYVVSQLTGGLGREFVKTLQTINATATGDELPDYKIPLWGRFKGSTEGPSGQATQYNDNVRKLNIVENNIKGRARDEGEGILGDNATASDYMAKEPLSNLVGMGNSTERQISKLRQYRASVQRRAEPGYQDEVRQINEQIAEVMTGLNREVNRAKKEAAVE